MTHGFVSTWQQRISTSIRRAALPSTGTFVQNNGGAESNPMPFGVAAFWLFRTFAESFKRTTVRTNNVDLLSGWRWNLKAASEPVPSTMSSSGMSKRMQELRQPNPVKGSTWLKEQQKKLSKAAVGQVAKARNSEGYFTTVYAHNADPYIDPAKVQRMFSRQTSGPSFKAPRSTKLPGQGFDQFKSLYTGCLLYTSPSPRDRG